MEQYFMQNGIWWLMIYLGFRDIVIPTFRQYLPARIKEREKGLLQLEQGKLREADLKEREVVAQEMIGKTLAIVAERMSRLETSHQTIMAALATAQASLAILVDRVGRKESS